MRKEDADWIGKPYRRWSWGTFSFRWGRMHYRTNACGDTVDSLWVWEGE